MTDAVPSGDLPPAMLRRTEEAAHHEPPKSMATILVVEDDPAVGRMMTRFLELKGHHAVLAPDGPSALTMARQDHPNLILLDMMMPDMDGLEVLRRLKAEPDTADYPVVIFSAVSDPKVIDAARREGAEDYWVKASFRFEELPRRLAAHLNQDDAGDDASLPH